MNTLKATIQTTTIGYIKHMIASTALIGALNGSISAQNTQPEEIYETVGQEFNHSTKLINQYVGIKKISEREKEFNRSYKTDTIILRIGTNPTNEELYEYQLILLYIDKETGKIEQHPYISFNHEKDDFPCRRGLVPSDLCPQSQKKEEK